MTLMSNCCRFGRSMKSIMLNSSMRSVRFTIALSSLVFALLLWWPGTLFTAGRTTYRLMAEIAPENVWGVAFFIHFIFATRTLIWCQYNRWTFIGDAVWGAVIWTVATVACFAAHWQHGIAYAPPAAMSAEIGVLFASWWYMARWIARK